MYRMSDLTRAAEISRLVFMIGKNVSNENGTVSMRTYFGHVVFLLDKGVKKKKMKVTTF